MKRYITQLGFVVLVAILAVLPLVSAAQTYRYPSSLEEAIGNPAINDNKQHKAIVSYQENMAKGLLEKNLNVMRTRNDEVIMVTIPADFLFAPNDTQLLSNADNILKQFSGLMRQSDFYRMVLAMYHDDTGSAQFCKSITEKRLLSVFDWFSIYSSTQYISRFACGNSNPILPNNSIFNRRQNRRLEIYLIPGSIMIEQAKKGLLK